MCACVCVCVCVPAYGCVCVCVCVCVRACEVELYINWLKFDNVDNIFRFSVQCSWHRTCHCFLNVRSLK